MGNLAVDYLNKYVNEGLQRSYERIEKARLDKFYEAEADD